MQLSSGYHCTRAKEPTDQDCSKLMHLTGHLWAIRFIHLIIIIDDKVEVVTCIDRVNAVHADGKGHSWIFLIMGKGATVSASKKLGMVTASSTETETVEDGERL